MNHLHRSLQRLLFIAFGSAVASCATVKVRKDEPVASWVARDSVQRKSAAASQTGADHIAGRSVNDFFLRHSAIVSDGGMPRVEFRGPQRTPQLLMPVGEGYGSAVSLGDGYFLTAAHVPLKGHGGLYCREGGTRPVVKPYRVVWADREADIALLHAPVDVPAVKWADAAALATGSRIFTYGFGGGEWKASHGQVTGSKPAGEAHLDVGLSAPVVTGDSGGPAVTADGKLAGVVSRADYRWVQLFGRAWMRSGSHAARPDLDMLHGIIARDRATRH